LFATKGLYAQKFSVIEITKNMSLGNAPAQCVSIYQLEEKVVLKDFSKMVSMYKAKSDIRKGEMKALNARIKALAADSLTIYANTEQISKDEVRLCVFIQHKNQWLNQSSPIVQYIHKDLYTFAVNESRKPVESKIKRVSSDIELMHKQNVTAEQENAKLKKDIEKCKKIIKENEDKISENENLISSTTKDIDELKKQLSELQQQLKNLK
jgi:chromosome segregation ATPase